AAAEDSGELAAILRAAVSREITRDALEPAERDGLVSVVDGRLHFRHPLVRSAIYQGTTFPERRQTHTAPAHALDETGADRSARAARPATSPAPPAAPGPSPPAQKAPTRTSPASSKRRPSARHSAAVMRLPRRHSRRPPV